MTVSTTLNNTNISYHALPHKARKPNFKNLSKGQACKKLKKKSCQTPDFLNNWRRKTGLKPLYLSREMQLKEWAQLNQELEPQWK